MLNNQRIIWRRKHMVPTYARITHNFLLGAE